jgi:cold shock CspA family protein
MALRRSRLGRVERFDAHAGLGVVVDEHGSAHPFHCTAIADGSRSIEPGTPVRFSVEPGRLGELEAVLVEPR